MTKRSLFRYWRELSLWPRIVINSIGGALIALSVEASLSGLNGDLSGSLLFGAFGGVFFALIDHITNKFSAAALTRHTPTSRSGYLPRP